MAGDNVRRWKSYTTLYFFGKPGFCKDFANDCKEKVTGIKVWHFLKYIFFIYPVCFVTGGVFENKVVICVP